MTTSSIAGPNLEIRNLYWSSSASRSKGRRCHAKHIGTWHNQRSTLSFPLFAQTLQSSDFAVLRQLIFTSFKFSSRRIIQLRKPCAIFQKEQFSICYLLAVIKYWLNCTCSLVNIFCSNNSFTWTLCLSPVPAGNRKREQSRLAYPNLVITTEWVDFRGDNSEYFFRNNKKNIKWHARSTAKLISDKGDELISTWQEIFYSIW